MRYRRGQPLVDTSLFFRIASFIVFYTVWAIAEVYYIVCMAARYETKKIFRAYKGKAILVSNHTTFLDPVLISGAVMPERIWHTLMEKTVETPYLGTLTRLLGGVPLAPLGHGIEKLMDFTDTLFRYKRFLHFYPEGECYLYNQEIRPFKSGAFYIAAKLNLPVIPLVTIFYKGFLPKTPRVRLVALESVHPASYIRYAENGDLSMASVKEYAEAVRRLMQDEIERCRSGDPNAGTQRYFKGQMPRMKGINE